MARRIVVVDDDEAIGELLVEFLSEEGYAVTLCPSGSRAYACVREQSPDAVMLDMHLETPNAAWQVLEQLQSDPVLSSTPVLICTADARLVERHAPALQDRGYTVVAKPFDLDQLLTLLQGLVSPRVA